MNALTKLPLKINSDKKRTLNLDSPQLTVRRTLQSSDDYFRHLTCDGFRSQKQLII